MIRKYLPNDFDRCVEIVNIVWDFDNRFHPFELARLFKGIYVGGSLSASNYAVVIEENNHVEGFIFGKAGTGNLFKTEYSGITGSIRFLVRLVQLKGITLKRKFFYLKIVGEHEKNRRKIEPTRENEVNLFAVDPHNQGRGYGKRLMNSFIEFCKENGVERITLDTDKECNYGFYDHFGFKIKGEFYSPLQKEYSGKSGDSFIYELKFK